MVFKRRTSQHYDVINISFDGKNGNDGGSSIPQVEVDPSICRNSKAS